MPSMVFNMITKSPPNIILRPEELAYISRINECERRQFLSTKAISLHKQGVSIGKHSKIMEVSKIQSIKVYENLEPAILPEKVVSVVKPVAGSAF